MTESMPSSVQPAHAPQNPTICARVSGVGRSLDAAVSGMSIDGGPGPGMLAARARTGSRDVLVRCHANWPEQPPKCASRAAALGPRPCPTPLAGYLRRDIVAASVPDRRLNDRKPPAVTRAIGSIWLA